MISRKTIQTPGFSDALARLSKKSEIILCSSLAENPFEKAGAPAVSPAGPPAIKPDQPGDAGCCDVPVKPVTIGDNSGSTANETGGKPGDAGTN